MKKAGFVALCLFDDAPHLMYMVSLDLRLGGPLICYPISNANNVLFSRQTLKKKIWEECANSIGFLLIHAKKKLQSLHRKLIDWKKSHESKVFTFSLRIRLRSKTADTTVIKSGNLAVFWLV